MNHGLAVAGVLLQGLACGVMLATAIGIFPMMQRMSFGQYAASVQLLWPRFDPVMPILNVSATLVNTALAITAESVLPRALFGSSALFLVVVIVISVVKNVPINKAVKALDPDDRPDGWADPRQSWRKWNLIRTSLAVKALATTVGGAVALGMA